MPRRLAITNNDPQGIFIVVDMFALDHNWPRTLVFMAMLAMLGGSLLVMANLRGTLGPYQGAAAGSIDSVHGTYRLVLRRSLRFNSGLYLTFLSILLLAAAAFVVLSQ